MVRTRMVFVVVLASVCSTKVCLSPARSHRQIQEESKGPAALTSIGECFLLFDPLFSPAGGKWILACRVNSSDRENRLSQPGWVQACGFSPVCVRIWRVWRERVFYWDLFYGGREGMALAMRKRHRECLGQSSEPGCC